ncbi:hypothetical protein EVAR_39925_1 [Eumeta japonica]|uniref:Uncharacterized protein n=1 Tax=Eumeta variegata TaxID=151549 RepID=A0A4C1WQS0_EUMVA|nr:hypothetical protein EVAR_39925_1 [Eumeta japonica]
MSKPNEKLTRNDVDVTTSHRQDITIRNQTRTYFRRREDRSFSTGISNSGSGARQTAIDNIKILMRTTLFQRISQRLVRIQIRIH